MQPLSWQPYHTYFPSHAGHNVTGDVRVACDVYSPQLHNLRDIFVYLPPSYQNSTKRYPVLYMQDGQNLFDPATSFAGEWGVDEALERLAREEGLEAIVVAIPNAGEERLNEYSPFTDAHHRGGKGTQYVNFVANTLKPHIDAAFRTRPERSATGIMGSSMGGLISLYAYFKRDDVFGFAGVMSPSFWFSQGAIFDFVDHSAFAPGRIYLDIGTREEGGSLTSLRRLANSRGHYAAVRRMKRILVNKGFRPTRDLLHIEEKWAGHNEQAWARRLPEALRFFIAGVEPADR